MFSNSTVIIHHCMAVAMFVDQIEGRNSMIILLESLLKIIRIVKVTNI